MRFFFMPTAVVEFAKKTIDVIMISDLIIYLCK